MTDLRRIVSENRRAVWIIAAGLAINAALYALVVYPLSQRVQQEQQQAGEATRALVAAQRAHTAARDTVTGKKLADEELQKFYREVLPTSLSGARRTLFPRVQDLARTANLSTFGSDLPPPQPVGASDLRKMTITLDLAGEYTNIRRFIHDLEMAPEFLVLENVTLTQSGAGERSLNVSATVATYYRRVADGN